ncbi:MAG: hypothetical protein EOO47_04290 [Flavobacterium sp.]|nr:MAG: hypothetical protein EOO47_04290 [Flavobacterium sp.]
MDISTIREQIQIEIATSIEWDNLLSETNPGHYGVEYWEVEVHGNGLWVDIKNRTFSFKDASLSATFVLGASKGDMSFNQDFNTTVSGKGTFEFAGSDKIQIDELSVEGDMDIYKD